MQRRMSPNTLETDGLWERKRPQENSREKQNERTEWKRGAKARAGAGEREEWQFCSDLVCQDHARFKREGQ